MSATIPFKLTSAGIDAAFNLGVLSLDVTHVQLGSGNRTPNGLETALVTPQESATISGHFEVSIGQHRISSVVAGSASAYNISEIGLWAGAPGSPGSVLVFYWSQASGYVAVKSASVNFNFESDLFFGGVVPGNITIVADTEFNALAMIADHDSNPDAHRSFTTPPLGDDTTKPATTEWVNDTIGKVLSKSVAGGANVTLTAVEAGHGILKFTGALTANINVILPASPTRTWVVENATTGAYTLTVKTAAGTGVAIFQGKRSIVYSDGTNIDHVLDFTASLNSNGYQKLPSGLIIQWGSWVASATTGNPVAVTFPIAFPNGIFAIAGISGSVTGQLNAQNTAWTDTLSQTGFNGHAVTASSTVRYIAIGY